jgi:hypothetical protein
LTEGEVAMARQVFKSAIRYDEVTVRAGSLLTLGGQAMAPFGHLHFPRARCLNDFSRGSAADQVWFIHEMAHVWQRHQAYGVARAGLWMALKGGYLPGAAGAPAYRYHPQRDAGKRLCDFNMEQQADLIAHYFDARFLPDNPSTSHALRCAHLPFYEAVLADFLRDPAAPACLPITTRVPPPWPGRRLRR